MVWIRAFRLASTCITTVLPSSGLGWSELQNYVGPDVVMSSESKMRQHPMLTYHIYKQNEKRVQAGSPKT